LNLFLINSVSSDPFCAIYNGHNLSVSRVSEINRAPKPQDKLINCLHTLAGKYDLQKIDALSVVTGPGSFTGIRVGLAIAKGIALALNKKIIPLTNFELTLNRLPNLESEKKYCVLIPAKLPEYYYAFTHDGRELSSGYIQISNISTILTPFSSSPSERGLGGEAVVVCDFDNETKIKLNYLDLLNVKDMKPETDSMLELSIKYYNEGRLFTPDKIIPLYIKDFIVKK
jgi:tRNA threonylcarbamoyladenosine biosynthesis protein TsaB